MLPPVKSVWSVSPLGAVDGVFAVASVSHRHESGPKPGLEPGSPLSQADMRVSSEPRCPSTRAVIPSSPTKTQRPALYVEANTVSPKSSTPLWIDTCHLVFDG